MGKSEFVLLHLLKWQFQPVKRTSCWRQSIKNGRHALAKLLRDNPSFAPQLASTMGGEYAHALDNAAAETGLPESSFPKICPYDETQLRDASWLPD